MTRETPKRFSMIREFHVADWLTLGNAVCGTCALFSSMSYLQTGSVEQIYVAFLLICAGLAFDILDGRVARWRQKSSAMGRELDSLADVISFGVAPAVLAYACGMQGLLDRVVLVFFVACGVSRLARFNVTADQLSGHTGKVKYFEGTPIPTSIGLAGLLTVAASNSAIGPNLWFGALNIAGDVLHPLVLLFLLSGLFMISRIRIPKL